MRDNGLSANTIMTPIYAAIKDVATMYRSFYSSNHHPFFFRSRNREDQTTRVTQSPCTLLTEQREHRWNISNQTYPYVHDTPHDTAIPNYTHETLLYQTTPTRHPTQYHKTSSTKAPPNTTYHPTTKTSHVRPSAVRVCNGGNRQTHQQAQRQACRPTD